MLGDAVQEYFDAYLDMIGQNLPEQPDKVRELGEKTERYVSQLRKYCLRLSQQKMQDKAARTLSLLTGSINNYAEMAEKITAMKETFLAFRKEGTGFSEEAAKDLKMFGSAVQEILEVTVHNYTTRNTRLAGTIQAYREVITDMLGKIKGFTTVSAVRKEAGLSRRSARDMRGSSTGATVSQGTFCGFPRSRRYRLRKNSTMRSRRSLRTSSKNSSDRQKRKY